MRHAHHEDRDALVLDSGDHAIIADPPAPEAAELAA
jgi:hypothetical protein